MERNTHTHFTTSFSTSLPCKDKKVDSEEDLFGSDSEMATTQELPGLGDDVSIADSDPNHGGESEDEGDADSQHADDGSSEGGSNRKDASKNGSSPNLRTLYWNVVHEHQKKIKKSNPEMPGREVLKLARKASLVIKLKNNTIDVLYGNMFFPQQLCEPG